VPDLQHTAIFKVNLACGGKIRRMLAANWYPDEPSLGPAMSDLETLGRLLRADPRDVGGGEATPVLQVHVDPRPPARTWPSTTPTWMPAVASGPCDEDFTRLLAATSV
jgi:hypothetical protein